MSKKYDMIIFDVDGTLCDTVALVHDSINEVLAIHGINKKVDIKDIRSGQGMNKENFAKNCMSFLDKDVRDNILTEADNLKNSRIDDPSVTVFDGVKETIAELSEEHLIGIVSNCGPGYIEAVIPKIGISEYVTDYLAASALFISKADGIKEMMKRNNAKNAVYVGDTLLDKSSCDEAGVDFVFASYGFGEVHDTQYRINKFSELIKEIKRMENSGI